MKTLTALVVAGTRAGGDPLASGAGVSHKALIATAGRAMIEHVVLALDAVPEISVVSPNRIGGMRMAAEMVRPRVVGFLDHMLTALARHARFDIDLQATGDLHIDEHHTVEDCALTLGEALDHALGDRRGIGRYGFTLPMDESLAQDAIDLSGRPAFAFEGEFPREQLGDFSTEMVRHFFAPLSQSLRAAIHMQVKGENTHHMIEALFKAEGRALRPALARDSLGGQ